jgi:hypothetical protein
VARVRVARVQQQRLVAQIGQRDGGGARARVVAAHEGALALATHQPSLGARRR